MGHFETCHGKDLKGKWRDGEQILPSIRTFLVPLDASKEKALRLYAVQIAARLRLSKEDKAEPRTAGQAGQQRFNQS